MQHVSNLYTKVGSNEKQSDLLLGRDATKPDESPYIEHLDD